MRATNQIQPLLTKAIALTLAISFFAPAIAHAGFPENPCPGFFTRLLPPKTKPNPDLYFALRDAKISDYFPETVMLKPQPQIAVVGAKISDETLMKFEKDFDSLLNQRAATFGFPAEDFRVYLRSKHPQAQPYPVFEPLYLEQAFKAMGVTLEDVQNVYFLEFLNASKKSTVAEVLDRMRIADISRIALTMSKKLGKRGWAVLGGAMVAGPVAGIVNSFFSAPMKPILESSEQASNILFSSVAQMVQHFTGERISDLRAHMSEMKSITDTLDKYDFNDMDREEAKKIMGQLEARYNKVFLRFKSFMPQYQQIGREIVRDWLIMQPLQLANHASTFNSEYTMNEALLSALEEKIAARGTPATAKEKETMDQFRENMESAENRLAVTLASWKLYTFAFAEVSRRPANKDANAMLMGTLTRYQKFMNMDKYRKELSAKIKEAFENLDPSFSDLQKLEKRREE